MGVIIMNKLKEEISSIWQIITSPFLNIGGVGVGGYDTRRSNLTGKLQNA